MKIIIIGAGEVGFHIASHLASEDKDVVVIDANAEAPVGYRTASTSRC